MQRLNSASYPKEFRPDIQALRALAVLLVVLWHGSIVGFHGGFIGVDVFFVVSGFVITNVLLDEHSGNGRASIFGFYARRIRRILPAATVVLILTIFFTYHYLSFITGADVANDAKYVARFWGNFHFSAEQQNYFTMSNVSTLTQYWSLAVEEQFYFVWPLLFVIVACWSRVFTLERFMPCAACGQPLNSRENFCAECGAPRAVKFDQYAPVRLIGILTAIVGVSLWYSIYETSQNATSAFYSPFTRAWELALGALLAVCGPWLRAIAPKIGLTLQVLGTAAILVATWVYTSTTAGTEWPGSDALWPVLATVAVIAGGSMRGVDRFGWFAKWKPIQWMGNISFSLYLVHYPIIIIAEQYASPGTTLPWYSRLMLVELSIQVAAVLYYLVENPIRRAKFLRRNIVLTYAVGLLLVAASYGAIYWHLHNEGSLAMGRGPTAPTALVVARQ